MTQPRFLTDFRHIIDYDSWAWAVIWGEPRTGKSTLALQVAWKIYKDVDDVLNCFVWNLSDLIYKIKKGVPRRFPTFNGLHMRVPLLVYDDFGSTGNKAKTQHDESWDLFKSAFDTLGTKLAILMATMTNPTNPTQQLQEKFTHELWIPKRGRWKYDRVETRQNYKGWQPFQHKDWLDEGAFGEVPKDIFLAYDEMRTSLADEVLQSVEDRMVDVHVDSILKRVDAMDLNLMQTIRREGPLYLVKIKDRFGDEGKQALMKCKSRQLITMRRMGDHYYKADLTDLGLEVLKALPSANAIEVPTLSTN